MPPPTARRSVLLTALAAVLMLGAVACSDDGDGGPGPGGSPSSEAQAGDEAITMTDTAFSPGTITVAVGAEVTWTNADPFRHTTTSDDGGWDSGQMAEGDTFSHTFDEAGTFSYVCEIHIGMTGEVVVE